MKPYIFLIITLLSFGYSNGQDIKFDDYFETATLRMDYQHAGTSKSETVYLEFYKKEKFWGGTKTNLISPFDFGNYKIVVKDLASGKTIFTNGFSTLFMEWQTTAEAKKTQKSFYESVVMPFPKKKSIIEIHSIDNKQKWKVIYKDEFNPDNYFIKQDNVNQYKVVDIIGESDPSKALDIVFLPEGYTDEQMEKFVLDVDRMKTYLFKVAPFNKYAGKINIKAVLAPSQESGTDIPGEGVWKNTILNSNFYTFDSERYLTTRDMKTMRDLASLVPYEQVYILVNTEKYGGGGIYNFYNLTSVDNIQTEEVFTHEFGHGLAWLADEYYYDDEMSEFYDKSLEPREANITTLVNFDKKWKNALPKGTVIPTTQTSSKIGVYEGGGYTSKGVYRAYHECKMKSNNTNEFCDVCQQTIEKLLKYYTE